jgi:hypothetical protein
MILGFVGMDAFVECFASEEARTLNAGFGRSASQSTRIQLLSKLTFQQLLHI